MTVATEDFDFFRAWLRERSAIVLEPGKEYLVDTRLAPVAQKAGLASVADLIQRLRRGSAALEVSVVEALTTNETSFFRDWKPFEALRLKLVPEAMVRRAAERRLDLWSAACSSGQEAYSLAMMLRDTFPDLAGWTVTLHCTDLSREMVERTRAGRYSQLEVNRGLPAPMLVKHFHQEQGVWVVQPALRALVKAQTMNLAAPWPVLPPMDLVLLRNVLIYFDIPTRRGILEKARRQLAPGGALFLGSAETTLGVTEVFKREEAAGTTYFRAG
jgi:chemotaxis protein methyltransferase CheR